MESNSGVAPESAKLDRAYRELKNAVLAGEYQPNERLVEAVLTARLGISRNTLRTVFARLESESVIVLEPNRGARVRAFSVDEAEDVLQVREVNEGLVAALAAQRATKQQLLAIKAAVRDSEMSLKNDDVVAFSRANRRFHELLLDASGSAIAGLVLEFLHFPIVKYQFQAVLVPGRKAKELQEHRAVLKAVEKHDPVEAERLMREHIREVRATIALAAGGAATAG